MGFVAYQSLSAGKCAMGKFSLAGAVGGHGGKLARQADFLVGRLDGHSSMGWWDLDLCGGFGAGS
jgi:hypothetical protein